MILPGMGAWVDGDEAVATILVGDAAAGAAEVGVEGRWMLVLLVEIATGGIGLPELDYRVPDRPAVAVEDAAADDNALAQRLAGVLPRQIVLPGADVAGKHWCGEIVRAGRQSDQGFGRGTEPRANG